jgi:hypothetical protein
MFYQTHSQAAQAPKFKYLNIGPEAVWPGAAILVLVAAAPQVVYLDEDTGQVGFGPGAAG